MTAARVSCIVPAYNEAARIGAVLEQIVGHPDIAEVIVVDDGSTDGTAEVVSRWVEARLIRMSPNGGKTAALAAGIAAAESELLLLLDADLVGLTPADVSALIGPVREGRADMSISLRRNAPFLWHWIGIDYISGERVLPRALVTRHLETLPGLPRFGFEVFLNAQVIAERLTLSIVPWPGVRHELKSGKHGFWRGVRGDACMIADMVRSRGARDLVRQIVTMRRLRIGG